MGLCKCRTVSNLFCYEHKKNVCEKCMADHPRCVVKSYLQWLQDSDYETSCQLCSAPLAQGEVVRLLCYDVFHAGCLDRHARSLPADTAHNGYRCPACQAAIIPAPNVHSPVAETLRRFLAPLPWAHKDGISSGGSAGAGGNGAMSAGPPLSPTRASAVSLAHSSEDSAFGVAGRTAARPVGRQSSHVGVNVAGGSSSSPDADDRKYARRANNSPGLFWKLFGRRPLKEGGLPQKLDGQRVCVFLMFLVFVAMCTLLYTGREPWLGRDDSLDWREN